MNQQIRAHQSALPNVPNTGVPLEDRWLSVDEIAAYLGIKRDTVYKWINEKSMPAHRLGRYWKFKRDEVDSWVKTGGASGDE